MEEAKARCPKCGSAFPAGATFCPQCGFVVPLSGPVDKPAEPTIINNTPAPAASPPIVFAAPVETRDSSAAAWTAVIVIALLLGAGLLLWKAGYLGSSPSVQESAPPNVTIENNPQISPQQEPTATNPPSPPPSPTPPSPTPPTPPAKPDQPSPLPNVDIVSVSAAPLNQGEVEWQYGYTLKLRNNAVTGTRVNVRIEFKDADGFTVDDDVLNGVFVPANSEREFNDFDMIKAETAQRIKTVQAELR